MRSTSDEFDWAPLGHKWWSDAGEVTGADERQLRFACCRFRGMNRTASAIAAGYTGTKDTIRQSASKTDQTKIVRTLLALATSENGASDGLEAVDDREALQILSTMARGGDAGNRIRALEAIGRIKERDAEKGRLFENDGLGGWRVARDFIQIPHGSAAFLLMWNAQVASIPLLHDIHAACVKEDPDVWDRAYRRESARAQASVDMKLRDPDWQREARIKLWREIGVEIEDASDFSAPVPSEGANAKGSAPHMEASNG